MVNTKENLFLTISLSQIPRILGFLNTDPHSRTHGCCDRYFWHYKIIDFPNARFQEAVLILALVYQFNLKDNVYFRSSQVKEWIRTVITFWGSQRHLDGSVDESYPNEHHFCATAFSALAVTDALLLLKENSPVDLSSTGEFLLRYNNMEVSNQMASAAAVLYNLYLLTGEEKYKAGFERKISLFLASKGNEVFFPEYGGFDIGYNSITLSLLGKIYSLTLRDDIKNIALDCCKYILNYIDDDAYYNPEKMSRRTQFLYPYGFALFAPDILERIENGLRKNAILNPSWMDDRYCIPMTADYLMTAVKLMEKL